MPVELVKNMKIKLPTGEVVKIYDVTDTLVYAKTLGDPRRVNPAAPMIGPMYTYAKSDLMALDGLGVLEDMIIKEPKKE